MEETVQCKHCNMMLKNTPKGIGSHMGHYHKDIVAMNKKVVEFTIRCLECNRLVANSNNVLGRHVRKEHGLEYPDYLVKHEHDGIWPTCHCNTKVRWHLGGFSKFCSKSCAAIGVHNSMFGKKGQDNPNTGKIRTPEMRAAYSCVASTRWADPNDIRYEIMKSDEYRQKQSEAQLASFATTDRAEKIAKSVNTFWASDSEHVQQLREKASERAIRLQEEGKIGPQAPFKTKWVFNPFTEQNEFMHSSWETAFLQKCIRDNNPVTKRHDIRIRYVDNKGKRHKYIPDFLSLTSKKLYEVKGRRDKLVEIKAAAAREWCAQNGYTYEMIEDKP